jgi:hypothetical protein
VRHGRTDGNFSVRERLAAGASLSGGERNHLFLNRRGTEFIELSDISGADDPADGRAFAILDFDRDGWQDLAVVNANAPLFQLFRNQLGHCIPQGEGHVLALRLVGGNHAARPDPAWSARDGYGALVTVALDSGTIIREHRAGEGFAAQNSPTLLIGMGHHPVASSLTVRWPSGKVQQTAQVPAHTLVIVYENPAHSPTGQPFVLQPYGLPRANFVSRR